MSSIECIPEMDVCVHFPTTENAGNYVFPHGPTSNLPSDKRPCRLFKKTICINFTSLSVLTISVPLRSGRTAWFCPDTISHTTSGHHHHWCTTSYISYFRPLPLSPRTPSAVVSVVYTVSVVFLLSGWWWISDDSLFLLNLQQQVL